jgi:hypothetical protein
VIVSYTITVDAAGSAPARLFEPAEVGDPPATARRTWADEFTGIDPVLALHSEYVGQDHLTKAS